MYKILDKALKNMDQLFQVLNQEKLLTDWKCIQKSTQLERESLTHLMLEKHYSDFLIKAILSLLQL